MNRMEAAGAEHKNHHRRTAAGSILSRSLSISFPNFAMGQYFKAVNTDKKEYACSLCMSGGAKLWEWAANRQGAIFTLLLRKSDHRGGGDTDGPLFENDTNAIAGRWAGDRVILIGDYDSSDLYYELSDYRNISKQLTEEWNAFMGSPDYEITFNSACRCGSSTVQYFIDLCSFSVDAESDDSALEKARKMIEETPSMVEIDNVVRA